MKPLLSLFSLLLTLSRAEAQTPMDTERVYPEDRLTVVPVVLRQPTLVYPDSLRRAGIGGTVHVSVVLDAKGRPEPLSVHVVSSPDTGLNGAAGDVVLGTRFSPGRVADRRVRALLEVEVAFDPLDTATAPSPVYGGDDSLTQKPALLMGPPLHYPEELQHRGIQGRVMVQLIIDTLGHAEPASIQFLTSPDVEFEQPVRDYLVFARFRPARRNGRLVRFLVYQPIDFRMRGAGVFICRPSVDFRWRCPP